MEAISVVWDSGVLGGMATMVVNLFWAVVGNEYAEVHKRFREATETTDRKLCRSRCRYSNVLATAEHGL